MFNKVVMQNPKRKRQKVIIFLLAFYTVILAVGAILLHNINNTNFNGQTKEITGIVSKVEETSDNQFVYLTNDDTKYTAVSLENAVDWKLYVEKTVTLVVPQQQFGDGPCIILGVTVDGVELVNAQQTIDSEHLDGKLATTVLAAIATAFAIATTVVTIFYINTAHDKQFDLAEKYVEFYAVKQPTCKQRITVFVIAIVAAVIIIATAIASITLPESQQTASMVLLTITSFLAAADLITCLFLSKWALSKEIDFYQENFPFDFSKVSHIRTVKKKDAEKLEKEFAQERQLHPDDYGDGGNGFMLRFGQDGVQLIEPDEYDSATATEPENVYGDVTQVQPKPLLTLTYERLNFEAVAIFRKVRPLFVVIKSRLEKTSDLPDDMVNDLHLILDKHLLATLQKFNVKVENLDYILQNKKALMTEHCFKKNPNQ